MKTRMWLALGLATVVGSVMANSCGGDVGTDNGSTSPGPTSSGTGAAAGTTGSGGAGGTASGGGSSSSSSGSGGQGGATGGNGGMGTGGSGGAPCLHLGDTCSVCQLQNCHDVYCDCYYNSDCIELIDCVELCQPDDDPCIQSCWTAHPNGISAGALVWHCAATDCSLDCPPTVPLTDCDLCMFQKCPSQMNGCLSNPDCVALAKCVSACTTSTCEQNCYVTYPGGTGDAIAVFQCQTNQCVTECSSAP